MEYQRDVYSEEAIMNLYNGINQDIPTYVYQHPIYTGMVLKMILEIRDIENGHGRGDLAIQLLQKWISQCPLPFQQIAEDQALETLEKMCTKYGCWKDIPQLCFQLSLENPDRYQFFIKRALQGMNDYLYNPKNQSVFWIAKWIPRPQSKYGLFFDYMATDYAERFLENPPYSYVQATPQEIYKQVVSRALKMAPKPQSHSHKKNIYTNTKPKTKRSAFTEETVLIQRALAFAQTPPKTPEEEDKIEEEWLKLMELYETLDNTVTLLDTPLTFKQTPQNIQALKITCRLLYKSALPSKKHLLITTAPEPYWFNAMGKTLVETIRTMVAYTQVNDNPTDKSQKQGIQHWMDTLLQCQTSNEDLEKMTWIILSEFQHKPPQTVHQEITEFFVSTYPNQKQFPQLTYIQTDPQKIQYPPTPLFISSTSMRTCWITLHENIGIPNGQWNQIAKITKDFLIRHFTPFQHVMLIGGGY